MPRIYHADHLHADQLVTLTDAAAHHVQHVLRLKIGEEVTLFNGDGNEYAGNIHRIHKKQVIVQLTKALNIDRESALKIHLGQALTRSEKMDWIIQKAVELGVTDITPLWTQHCAIRYNAQQLEKKMLHWQGIIISACEQSGRNKIPVLHSPSSLSDWLTPSHTVGFILAPQANHTFKTFAHLSPTEISVLIGPEGGWHATEIAQAKEKGFHALRLGARILRMETAALAAVSVTQSVWGDFA